MALKPLFIFKVLSEHLLINFTSVKQELYICYSINNNHMTELEAKFKTQLLWLRKQYDHMIWEGQWASTQFLHFGNLEMSGCSSHSLESASKNFGSFVTHFGGRPMAVQALILHYNLNALQFIMVLSLLIHISSFHESLPEIFIATLILVLIKYFFFLWYPKGVDFLFKKSRFN